jgi:L-rhamnonate dehydratase
VSKLETQPDELTGSGRDGTLIVDVDAIVLRAPSDTTDLDASSDTVIVQVTDEAGRIGLGEADAPPAAVRELVLMDDQHAWSRGMANVLVGRDPFPIAALHAELYQATIYFGRRGLGIHALSAVDIALHDLVGKQLGRPAFELLGGARRPYCTPYATVYQGAVNGRSLSEMMDVTSEMLDRSVALGFRAAKLEVLWGELITDRQLVDCVREARRQLGDDMTLLVDFGYRWHDWRDALWALSRLEDARIYLAEATLQHDDLPGHARLAERVETRIGGAEMAATVFECREWLVTGGVDVLQPDVGRCGGLTEMRKIAEMAALEGATVIPHGWKTGLTAATNLHFQAATANAPYVEFFHPSLFDSEMRSHLVEPEPVIEEGRIALPTAPGLGVALVPETVARFQART